MGAQHWEPRCRGRFARGALLVAAVIGCASCTSPGGESGGIDATPSGSEADASTGPGRPDAQAAVDCNPACSDRQVCSNGTCQDLPAHCPCPIESYCDLSQDTCVAGCLIDDDCNPGRICSAERTCAAGCRTDDACETGSICESLQCQTGCRRDEQCTAGGQICENLGCRAGCRADDGCAAPGHICDNLTCRAGCRVADDCAAPDLCHLDTLTCAGCDDPDEARDTTITTRGRGEEAAGRTVARMLCNDPSSEDLDSDVVYWRPSFDPNGGVLRTHFSARLTVSGMERGAATLVTAVDRYDQSHSYLFEEDGTRFVVSEDRNLGCDQVCTFQNTITFVSDSRTPVTLTLHVLAE